MVPATQVRETPDLTTSDARGVDPRVRAINVKKKFTRAGGEIVNAVDNVSLSVDSGKMLVLLGPSGCGKTTLLRCIAGLERPDDGEIWANGRMVFSKARNLDVPPEKRDLGMMFQSYAVWPHMTVAENVAFPLVSRKFPKKEIAGRVAKALARVGIPTLGDQYPNRLSGGQQQRVALARSLVVDPKVVLFDEPLSNVDAKVREDLRVELAAQQQEVGFAGVYVTHDQVEALQLADSVAVLKDGQVVQQGTPEEVYHRPSTRYVANFVGRVNEIEATVVNIDAQGGVVADSPLGRLIGTGMDSSLAVGSTAVALIRPEALAISSTTGAVDGNRFEGSLVRSLFAGAYRDHLVRAKEYRLRVSEMGGAQATSIHSGDQLTLTAEAEHVLFYSR